MFAIDWQASGVVAFALQPPSQRDGALAGELLAAQRETLSAYATGALPASLPDRLQPSAFGVYGLTDRSGKYAERQRRLYGTEYPYRSPRSKDYGKVALALASGNAQAIIRALASLTRNQTPMATLLPLPGAGHLIRDAKGGKMVRAILLLPGARVLNRGGARNAIYRRELVDLTLGGGRDLKAIFAAYARNADDRIRQLVANARPVRLAA